MLATISPYSANRRKFSAQGDVYDSIRLDPNYGFIWEQESMENEFNEDVTPVWDGSWWIISMIESNTLARITTYMDENCIKVAMEAEFQQNLATEV